MCVCTPVGGPIKPENVATTYLKHILILKSFNVFGALKLNFSYGSIAEKNYGWNCVWGNSTLPYTAYCTCPQ